jgi:hypothetical protein
MSLTDANARTPTSKSWGRFVFAQSYIRIQRVVRGNLTHCLGLAGNCVR